MYSLENIQGGRKMTDLKDNTYILQWIDGFTEDKLCI
jgi:hypothetical protein